MSESQKLITAEVVYICEPLDFTVKPDFFDTLKKNAGDIVDKVMPENPVGKIAVGAGAAAVAFAAMPAGIVGTLAAGGIAAGVGALFGKDKKKVSLPENTEVKDLTVQDFLTIAKAMYKNDKDVNLDDIAVVPSDIAKSVFEADKTGIKNVRNLSAGLVLIRHPFLPDTYINIDATEKELFHNKQLCISQIMQLLGAKSLKGHATIVESKKRTVDANGNVSYKNIKLNTTVLSEQNQHYEAEYHLEDTFDGDYSMSDYNQAIEKASEFGLDKDDDIKHLIDQRNPENPRSIKSRRVSIEMSRELNSALDTAISLEAVGAELNGTYKEIIENQKRISFELEVQF